MDPIIQSIGYPRHDGLQRRHWRGAGGRSDFRVSLSRTSAAPSADQTAKTLAHLVPVGRGLILDLFDGEDWVPRRIAYDPDTANSRAVTTTDLAVMTTTTVPYDQFVRWRAGRAETKLVAWASATARNGASIAAPWLHESGLGMHEGILCRADGGAGAAAAGRLDPYWRYVATLYPSASGQCEDSAAKRFVWNMYGQTPRIGTGTFTANRSTSSSSMVELNSEIRVSWVQGLAVGAILVSVAGSVTATLITTPGTGIGIDGTTVSQKHNDAIAGADYTSPVGLAISVLPSIGFHYATVLGNDGNATTSTWHASDGTHSSKTRLWLQLVM